MELKDLSKEDLAIVCKLFGALFYYQPNDFQEFSFGTYFDQDDVETPISEVNQVLSSFKLKQQTLQSEHEKLFSMQENMPVPPWSSMYLDKESILFGKANTDYCEFIEHCGLGLRDGADDPEDHIGLMLIILGMLIEDEQDQHAKEMLGEYLATWSGFYFNGLKTLFPNSVYTELAHATAQLLDILCKQYSVQILIKNNFFQPTP